MKKSEIIRKLNENECKVTFYVKEDERNLVLEAKFFGTCDFEFLNNNGFMVFISAAPSRLLRVEITGNIEWD